MPQSRYKEIYSDLKDSIESDIFTYQSLLPSENMLCRQYDCSRSTVRRALSELTSEGYIQPIQGKGVRVIWRPETDGTPDYATGGLDTFEDTASRQRFEAATKVREFELMTVDEGLAKKTSFALGENIYYIDRVRLANNFPVSIEFSYLLQSEAPNLTEPDVEGSLYSYLENEVGIEITTGKRTITVERATDDDLSVFGLETLPAVGVMRDQHFDSNGTMFEYSEIRQHPSYFSVREVITRHKGQAVYAA